MRGQLNQVVDMSGGGRGVGARVAHAVDLDAEADELAGAEALPVVVRPQRERDAARRGAADGDDLRAHLAQREGGPHQLDVAIDAVGGRQRLGERGAEQTAGECLTRLSEHLCTR